jgi:hypothetical protein
MNSGSSEYPTWEVKLSVDGPIKSSPIPSFKIFKGCREDDPFYSDISIKNSPYGVAIFVTAFAPNSELARKAAILFIGKMLDTLALKMKLPLFLSFTEEVSNRKYNKNVRRIIEKEEWVSAFKDARLLNKHEPTFLRALGWYRKGLYTNDSYDKFLSFWNSIEITATKYHPKTERTSSGSKNQIWECFKTLWGECANWPIIGGNEQWIDENNSVRKSIAHGVAPITVEYVKNVLDKLGELEQIAHLFLVNWRNRFEISDHLSSLLEHIGIEASFSD